MLTRTGPGLQQRYECLPRAMAADIGAVDAAGATRPDDDNFRTLAVVGVRQKHCRSLSHSTKYIDSVLASLRSEALMQVAAPS